MDQRAKEKAIKFQESELAKLSKFSYEELASLPSRSELASPDGLEKFNFACEVKNDEFGGLEVNVFHYFIPEYEVPDDIKKAIGNLDIMVGESKFCRWFNILPSGFIEWPSFEHEDGED